MDAALLFRPRLAEKDLAFFQLASQPQYGSLVSSLLFAKDMPKIDFGGASVSRERLRHWLEVVCCAS